MSRKFSGFFSYKIENERKQFFLIYVVAFDPNKILNCQECQNDRLILSLVKDNSVVGEKMTRNGRKIVPKPSCDIHFRSESIFTLFMTLIVLKLLVPTNQTVPPGLLLNHSDWAKCLEGRQVGSQSRNICLGRPMLPRVILPRCSNSMQDTICSFRIGIQNQPFSLDRMGQKMLLQIFPHF